MKDTVIIHSGHYEMLAISHILKEAKVKPRSYSSLTEFFRSGPGMSVGFIILEVKEESSNFDAAIKFLRRLSFYYTPPQIIVMTKIEKVEKLSLLAELQVDMLISEQEDFSILRKMLITGVTDLNYHMAVSPFLKQKDNDFTRAAKKHLTEMEWQVLSAIQQMKSNATIACKLGRSVKTVSTHKRNAMKKLGLKNSIELYKYLMQ